MKKIIYFILGIILITTLSSAVTLQNVTIKNNNSSFYVNSSSSNGLSISESEIVVDNISKESIFSNTGTSNASILFINLDPILHSIISGSNSTLTANISSALITTEPDYIIKVLKEIIPVEPTTPPSSGGSSGGSGGALPMVGPPTNQNETNSSYTVLKPDTTQVYKNTIRLYNPTWYANQINTITAYVYSLDYNLQDPKEIIFLNSLSTKKIGTGIYEGSYETKDITSYNVTVLVNEDGNNLTKSKRIKVYQPTTVNKAISAFSDFGNNTFAIFQGQIYRILGILLLIILGSITLTLVLYSRSKGRPIRRIILIINSTIISIIAIYSFNLDNFVNFIENPFFRFLAILVVLVFISTVSIILIKRKIPEE